MPGIRAHRRCDARDPVCTLTSDRAIIDAMLDGTPPPVVYAYREMGRTREAAIAAVSTPDPALR